MNIFLQCFLKRHLQQQFCLFLLVSSILDLMMAIILEPNLSPMMTVTSTRILGQKPSINIKEIFKINTSGIVICRIVFCCDILQLFDIAIFLYHVHSVCKKSIECTPTQPCCLSRNIYQVLAVAALS